MDDAELHQQLGESNGTLLKEKPPSSKGGHKKQKNKDKEYYVQAHAAAPGEAEPGSFLCPQARVLGNLSIPQGSELSQETGLWGDQDSGGGKSFG